MNFLSPRLESLGYLSVKILWSQLALFWHSASMWQMERQMDNPSVANTGLCKSAWQAMLTPCKNGSKQLSLSYESINQLMVWISNWRENRSSCNELFLKQFTSLLPANIRTVPQRHTVTVHTHAKWHCSWLHSLLRIINTRPANSWYRITRIWHIIGTCSEQY